MLRLDPAHIADQAPSHHTGERRLAVGVIQQAFKDLRRGRAGARLWFTSEHSGLGFWCEALELDPDAVRNYVLSQPPQRRRGR
jgi:hypothetical protein